MPETAYTAHDTPTIQARIDRDLATIIARVLEADPRLRSLVLTGGFARGEGTVVDGQPQNDYDLVALRGIGPTREPYDAVAAELEQMLGLHIDLAPVPTWRLRWVPRSIFWYETALRAKTLWGADLLDRIPVRDPGSLEPTEGLRLLTNRAAGLLLVRRQDDAHAHRIQAAKALLAALDAHLLAQGVFPPSQTERWQRYRSLETQPASLAQAQPFLSWAFTFKTQPASADRPEPLAAWRAAARAVLDAVPSALDHARLETLEAYRRTDGLFDHVHYALQASSIQGASPFTLHPTGSVRVGTLQLLEASSSGEIDHAAAKQWLGCLAEVNGAPLDTLDALRRATLQ